MQEILHPIGRFLLRFTRDNEQILQILQILLYTHLPQVIRSELLFPRLQKLGKTNQGNTTISAQVTARTDRKCRISCRKIIPVQCHQKAPIFVYRLTRMIPSSGYAYLGFSRYSKRA